MTTRSNYYSAGWYTQRAGHPRRSVAGTSAAAVDAGYTLDQAAAFVMAWLAGWDDAAATAPATSLPDLTD